MFEDEAAKRVLSDQEIIAAPEEEQDAWGADPFPAKKAKARKFHTSTNPYPIALVFKGSGPLPGPAYGYDEAAFPYGFDVKEGQCRRIRRTTANWCKLY
jgi:hypothetical protein